MDISGIIQSYDSRSTSAALARTIMTPQYGHSQPYTGITSNALIASDQHIPQNPFGFRGYSIATPNPVVPAFTNINYIQQRPLPRLVQHGADGGRGVSYARDDRFVEERQSRSPSIKKEPQWNGPTGSPTFTSPTTKTLPSPLPNDVTEVDFGTDVDTLMKAIQAKSSTGPPQQSSPLTQSRPVVGTQFTPPYVQTGSQVEIQTGEQVEFKLTHEDLQDEASSPKGAKKRYVCTIKGCSRSFYQKTHLDIHIRKHTGDKPYECNAPGCGRSFSQLGNLKTHERRHTGDRPFACNICGKRFAQRGNVRAHQIVHDQAKPYLCRLDDCGKPFTQLGNLKSHQNKFHVETLRNLTSKFASIKDGDIVNAADKELWEYFANLYKNSNKGIKGRGKDRKVGDLSMARSSSMRGLSGSGFTMTGAGRSNVVVGVMGAGMRRGQAGRGDGQYEIFDADNASQAGSHCGTGSSVGTCYDEAPSDGFEDNGRAGDLAFGDRIY